MGWRGYVIHRQLAELLEQLLERRFGNIQAHAERATADGGFEIAQQRYDTRTRWNVAGVHLKQADNKVKNIQKRGGILRRIQHHLSGELRAGALCRRREFHTAADLLN